MKECYSCGKEANPDSPRSFCTECDAVFNAGIIRQKEVIERADRLKTAHAEGDADSVSNIMTEIFQESVVVPTTPDPGLVGKSSAVVKEGK